MKNGLRKDLHSLLKWWWKPKVTARRRKSLDLFKEWDRNKGERIRLIQNGLKLKRNTRWNIKNHVQGWEPSCHSLWHTKEKKVWTRNLHRICGKGQLDGDPLKRPVMLETPAWSWCSFTLAGCSCFHTTNDSAVSHYLAFHDEQKYYAQALCSGIQMSLATPNVQNSHTTECFCCPSLTWSLGQRGHSKEHS